MTRRAFCLSTLALPAAAAPAGPRSILVSPGDAGKLRGSADPAIRANADAALKAGPWSVTTRRPSGVPAGPHDYYSEGPYWWPDPKNPTGPYIRKDGQRNPARFTANRNELGSMCTAVLALGAAAWILGDRACAGHAARVLSTWFLDPATRMNPNLEFGQAVRGINTGRGTGLIDTVSLIHAVQGIWLLEQARMLDPSLAAGLRRWFAGFTRWMTTSSKGLDEKKSGNNHATWWTAQVAAYAAFTGDDAALSMAWDHYRSVLVPGEIRPAGDCPREEARTNSLSYSAMNLDAFAVLCRIAQVNGADLWTFQTPNGLSVAKAFHYLIPYLLHPDTWKKQQISPFKPDGTLFPGLAGIGLHDAGLLDASRALPRNSTPWVQFIDLLVKA